MTMLKLSTYCTEEFWKVKAFDICVLFTLILIFLSSIFAVGHAHGPSMDSLNIVAPYTVFSIAVLWRTYHLNCENPEKKQKRLLIARGLIFVVLLPPYFFLVHVLFYF